MKNLELNLLITHEIHGNLISTNGAVAFCTN